VAWGCGDPFTYFRCQVPFPNTGFTAVAAGWNHSLGLKIDGSIVGWGNNHIGQTIVPTPNKGFTTVAVGESRSLAIRPSPDCNGNGVVDECDVTACSGDPICADCNANSIPDGCEPDCNSNAISDECDIRDGTSRDANANGILDECEDGACCDLLIGVCTENVLDVDCSGAQRRWTEGAACVDVVCDAITGACCDHGSFGACTDGVTQAACDCPTCDWVKLGSCSELDCPHTAIPTVSSWGLAILSLLLMTGAKIRFGRV